MNMRVHSIYSITLLCQLEFEIITINPLRMNLFVRPYRRGDLVLKISTQP